MGKTVPGIRVQENMDDILIKIDKRMLVEAFEKHPEIYWEVFEETEELRPVEIENKNEFFEKVKYTIVGEKNDEFTWFGAFLYELILHIWREGDPTFVKDI